MTVACYQLAESELYHSIRELTEADAAALIAPVRLMLAEAGASTQLRIAHLLAQIAHESGGLRYLVEQGADAGAAYEGRKDLGNTQPGDGRRYKGRGWVQLTGRGLYDAAGKALGLDLVGDPELAARVEVSARVAAWYWRTHGCSEAADRDDLEGVTRRINGGLNHLEMRRARLAHAKAALGLSDLARP